MVASLSLGNAELLTPRTDVKLNVRSVAGLFWVNTSEVGINPVITCNKKKPDFIKRVSQGKVA